MPNIVYICIDRRALNSLSHPLVSLLSIMPSSIYLDHLSGSDALRRFTLATHHIISPFIDLVLLLRPLLDWSTRDGSASPLQLPANIEGFLQEALSISVQECRSIWSCFREEVWQRNLSTADEHSLRMRYASKLLTFGLGKQIGALRVISH